MKTLSGSINRNDQGVITVNAEGDLGVGLSAMEWSAPSAGHIQFKDPLEAQSFPEGTRLYVTNPHAVDGVATAHTLMDDPLCCGIYTRLNGVVGDFPIYGMAFKIEVPEEE